MSFVTEHEFFDSLGEYSDFQNLDRDKSWKDHNPVFEWTEEDLIEFEEQRRIEEADQHVPSWSSLFCEESEWGGPPFKCLTFVC